MLAGSQAWLESSGIRWLVGYRGEVFVEGAEFANGLIRLQHLLKGTS